MSFRAVWNGDILGTRFEDEKAASAATELAQRMSEISERCYHAMWESGTEEVLWSAVQGGPRKWGQSEVTQADIEELKALSDRSKGWITSSFDAPARFLPMEEWRKAYSDTV